MYQRLAMKLAADAEDEGDDDSHDLIRKEEEDRRSRGHHKHHDRGDRGFAARRPGDLVTLGAHLLQKLERTDLGHRAFQIGNIGPTEKDETDKAVPFGK